VLELPRAGVADRRCVGRDRGDVPGDGLLQAVGAAGGRDHRVVEAAEHPLEDRGEELVAVGEVDVEGAAGLAGAGADRVEAGRVDALLGELQHSRGDQRLAGLALALGPDHSVDIPRRM
jgi:hypothetical protein